MDASAAVRITVPEQELDGLTFCAATPEALANWVGSLPMASTMEAATQIRQASFEIARLKTDYQHRMALLETIRPTVHYLCARLDRTATTTNSDGDSIARLAQRLQTNLCSGYKAVICSGANRDAGDWHKDTLALALHRALSDLSRTLLRTLQFYVSPAERLWLELNQLYLLAERLQIANTSWEDSENHSRPVTSVADAYLRSILLATSKPNQLRHRQLSQIFNALELWTPNAAVEPLSERAVFVVDLESDQGPRYRTLPGQLVEPRGINTDVLVYELESYLKEMDGHLPLPDSFTNALVDHLADAWGVMHQRSFRRLPTAGTLKVCVGLRAAHYFLSGGVDFIDQLDQTDAMLKREVNPFLIEKTTAVANSSMRHKDVWDDAFDLRVRIPENPNILNPEWRLSNDAKRAQEGKVATARQNSAEHEDSYRFFDTTALDTSPDGYRIRWNEPLPGAMQTGDFLALRDSKDPRWCVAVIRWIRLDGEGTTMGIELLAPRAIPVGIRVLNKRGGPSDYARGFLLPELKLINQPATLITPVMPFQSGQKIHIQRQGVQATAQLTQTTLRTESFNQFSFRMLDGYLENARLNLNMNSLAEIIDDPSRDGSK